MNANCKSSNGSECVWTTNKDTEHLVNLFQQSTTLHSFVVQTWDQMTSTFTNTNTQSNLNNNHYFNDNFIYIATLKTALTDEA